MNRCLVLALLAAALAGCGRRNDTTELPKVERPANADAAPPADVRAVAAANNAFALDLHRQMKGENVFFSPLSVSTALSMTYAGARGETAAEMAKTLHYPFEGVRLHQGYAGLLGKLTGDGRPAGVQLSVANALWGNGAFKEDFLAVNRDCYAAHVRQIDLVGAEPVINRWAEEHTAGRIKNLVPDNTLTGRHRLVLTNAVYFKGDWSQPFEKSDTNDEPFRLKDGKKVRVRMMHQTRHFVHGEFAPDGPAAAQVLTMRYKGGHVSMVVVLPRAVDGLAKTEEALTAAKLDEALHGARTREVRLSLPRFKREGSKADLKDPLRSVGIKKAFDPDGADLSGMFAEIRTHVDQVLHKAFVEVTEEGAEAAAATALLDKDKGPMVEPPKPQPIEFRADHPFLFLIRDERTGAILFLGRLSDPR